MDKLTPAQRRKNMQAVKSKGSDIEVMLCRELWKRGLRYRKNAKSVYGHPDIVFIGKKVAVFCDSEFWHGYDWAKRKDDIKSNRDFWVKKIERNIERDIEVNSFLELHGWKVLRFWGKEIKTSCAACADAVEEALKNADYKEI